MPGQGYSTRSTSSPAIVSRSASSSGPSVDVYIVLEPRVWRFHTFSSFLLLRPWDRPARYSTRSDSTPIAVCVGSPSPSMSVSSPHGVGQQAHASLHAAQSCASVSPGGSAWQRDLGDDCAAFAPRPRRPASATAPGLQRGAAPGASPPRPSPSRTHVRRADVGTHQRRWRAPSPSPRRPSRPGRSRGRPPRHPRAAPPLPPLPASRRPPSG